MIGTLVAREVRTTRAAGRGGHGGPRPVPAGRRRRPGQRPVHDPRHQGPRDGRPGAAAGEVRRPVGAGVRGHGGAARGPERRAPGRQGDRREDRRRAPAPVRGPGRLLAARDAHDPGLTRVQRPAVEAADYLAVAPAVVRVAPDAPGRGRRPAGAARRPTPTGSSSSRSGGAWGRAWRGWTCGRAQERPIRPRARGVGGGRVSRARTRGSRSRLPSGRPGPPATTRHAGSATGDAMRTA